MTIFEMSEKQILRALRRFGKTNYGKGVFVMNFALPLLLMITGISFLVMLLAGNQDYAYSLLVNTLLFMWLFADGCRHFYGELKEFLVFEEEQKK